MVDRSAHQLRETALKSLIATLAVCCCLPSLSESADHYLPDVALVKSAIQKRAEVMAAMDRVDAATAHGRAIAIGEHEPEISVSPLRRRTDYEGRFNEWEVQLSRRFRLPGKAQLDRSIAARTVQSAAIQRKAVEHDAAVRLLQLWMDWLLTGATYAQTDQQLASLGQARDALVRRAALGDAARLDVDLMEAELAQAAVVHTEHNASHQSAAVALSREFPDLPLPVRLTTLPEPMQLEGEAEQWIERIVEHNHELLAMTEDASRHDLLAARARADRVADPLLGLRVLDERDGGERSVGVVFSIPIGTAHRSALASAAVADARAFRRDTDTLRRQLEVSARMNVIQATYAITRWQAQQRAYRAMANAAARTRTAWNLGEIALAEKLLAERRERDAAMEEQRIRSDALTKALLIRLDAHELWTYTDDSN